MRCALVLLCLCAVSPLVAENYLIVPFFNLSKDSNLNWIGESLSETVREALAAEGVIALDREDREEAYRRLSLRPFGQLTTATVIRLGEVLDADRVIYGHFDFTEPPPDLPKTRGTLKIVAQVLDIRHASRGPEYTEIGSLEDLARLQTHLGWQTVQLIIPDNAPSEEEFRNRRPAIRVEAIENYIRGLLASSPDAQTKLFTQAIRLDSRFSQASFQLGKLYWVRKQYKAAAEQFLKVASWDVRSREATFFLGLCRYRLGDYANAAEAFRLVAQSVPLNEVWNNLGAAQLRLNSPEALTAFRKALEGDPTDPDYQFNVGYALLRQGNGDEAAEHFRKVLERRPDDSSATAMLERSTQGGGRITSRTEGAERIKENYEESVWLQLKAVLEPKRK